MIFVRCARPKIVTGQDCCRAQNDDRPFARAASDAPGAGAGVQPGQRLLSAKAGSCGGSRHHASRGRAAHELPFTGSRMLRDLLRAEGIKVGRLHVSTLMKKMAVEAIYRRPNTSKAAADHKIYPYLLRKLPIVPPNQV